MAKTHPAADDPARPARAQESAGETHDAGHESGDQSEAFAARPSLDGFYTIVDDTTWLQEPVGAAAARRTDSPTGDVPGVPREGITAADADLLRPWWARQENRVGMAIVGAAALLCIVVVVTVLAHRPAHAQSAPSPRSSVAAPAAGPNDSSSTSDSADTPPDASPPGPAATVPGPAAARDSAAVAPAPTAPPTESPSSASDAGVARPVGPQSVPPITPSSETVHRNSRVVRVP